MQYLSVQDLIVINEEVVLATGGSSGVRDTGLVESISMKPRATFGGEDLYPDVFLKAAVLYEAVINYHAFVDGNKRTGLASLIEFLLRNSFKLRATNLELEQYTLLVATYNPDLADVAVWVREHCEKPTSP